MTPRCWNCGIPNDLSTEIEVFINGTARYACSRDCELQMKEPTLTLIPHKAEQIPASEDLVVVFASAPAYRGARR